MDTTALFELIETTAGPVSDVRLGLVCRHEGNKPWRRKQLYTRNSSTVATNHTVAGFGRQPVSVLGSAMGKTFAQWKL